MFCSCSLRVINCAMAATILLLSAAALANLAHGYRAVDAKSRDLKWSAKTERVYSADHDDLHFVAIGDWGNGRDDQRYVAHAMARKCESGLADPRVTHSRHKVDRV